MADKEQEKDLEQKDKLDQDHERARLSYSDKLSGGGNTLYPIELDLREYSKLPFATFVDRLFADLKDLKNKRFLYYNTLRDSSRADWVRKWLVVLGVASVLLTGVAGLLRILQLAPYDIWCLSGALVAYALMGALTFYERTTDQASAYFRHLAVTLGIRDLWTKLEFALLREIRAVEPGDAASEKAGIDNICALAEAFCKDLDKLASDELGEWRTEFTESLKELDSAAKQGTTSAREELRGALQVYEKAAAEADEARRAAEALTKPALVNMTVNGEFDGSLTVKIDNKPVTTTHLKSFAIDRLAPGTTKIEAGAAKDGQEVGAAVWVDLKPGIQSLSLDLQ